MKNSMWALVMLGAILVFFVLLLIDAIQARRKAKAWFILCEIAVVVVAWVVNYIRAGF